MTTTTKVDPPLWVRAREPMSRQARGKLGMAARWGPPRILRLDQLDPVAREIIAAILTARENAKPAPAIAPEAAEEASGGSRRRPSAA